MLADEQKLVDHAQAWLTEQAERIPAYTDYLRMWGDWTNPWPAASTPA